MTIDLPEPIDRYFAGDRSHDLNAFVGSFAEDAIVVDERRTFTGRDEIREWKEQSSARFRYTAEPFAIAEQAGQTVVTAHLTGDFPGSPVDLRYGFTLKDGLIARLEIAP